MPVLDTGHFKQDRDVAGHRRPAGPVVEKRQHQADEQGEADAGLQQLAEAAFLGLQRSFDFLQLGERDFRTVHFVQDIQRIIETAFFGQPARAGWNEQQQRREQEDHQHLRTEHPAPGHGLGKHLQYPVGGQRRGGRADDDGELIGDAEFAANLRRRDFGEIHGRCHRADAHTHATDDPEEIEQENAWCQRGDDRAECQQQRGDDHGALTADAVTQPGPQKRTKHTAERRAGRAEAQHFLGEIELLLEIHVRRADQRQVVSEEEPTDGRCEGNGENIDTAASRAGLLSTRTWHSCCFYGPSIGVKPRIDTPSETLTFPGENKWRKRPVRTLMTAAHETATHPRRRLVFARIFN